jgi:hypothetical protein
MMRCRAHHLGALAAVLMLTACGGTVQEAFGIGKHQPDEFQIVRRQPLIIPPDSTLRPPRPGEPGPQDVSTADQARQVLTGTAPNAAPSPSTPDNLSHGESALLAEVKTPTDPDIRRKLLEENTELTTIDESRFLVILDFQRKNMTPKPDVINPSEEAARLRQQGIASTGPVTVHTGSTPLPPPPTGSS